MRGRLPGAVVVAMGLVAVGGVDVEAGVDPPTVRLFSSAREALAQILLEGPRVIAFGEFHETTGSAKVPSAIKRFMGELLPLLSGAIADLVVETWVTKGDCGGTEKAVIKDVETTTQRPVTTEDEVVTLIKRARAGGTQPHILELTCDEYRSLQAKEGGVDYERLLGLVTEKLEGKVRELLARAAPAEAGKRVAVYGGALHNDLYPREELRDYTFGPSVREAVGGKYDEVDLYVPEYVERDKDLRGEAWFPMWRRATRGAQASKTALVRRGPGSYIIVFARTPR